MDMKRQPCELGCPTIREKRLGHSGYRDVADPRYQTLTKYLNCKDNYRIIGSIGSGSRSARYEKNLKTEFTTRYVISFAQLESDTHAKITR